MSNIARKLRRQPRGFGHRARDEEITRLRAQIDGWAPEIRARVREELRVQLTEEMIRDWPPSGADELAEIHAAVARRVDAAIPIPGSELGIRTPGPTGGAL